MLNDVEIVAVDAPARASWRWGAVVLKAAPAMASARGVAIILVVLYHADVDLSASLPLYRPFLAVVDALRYVTVPLFLLCFGLASAGKAGSARQLAAEAVNYLYVYLLWVAISLALSATVAQANLSVPHDLHEFVRDLVLPSSPLWFPFGLFCMLLSAALLVRQSRVVRLAVAFGLGFVPLVVGDGRIAIVAISTNTIFFYVGLLLRSEIVRLIRRAPAPLFLLTGGGYAGLLLLAERTGLSGLQPVYVVLGLLGFAALTTFWMLQPIVVVSRFFARVGRAALPILVIHDFWIHLAERTPVIRVMSGLAGRAEILLPGLTGAFALAGSYATFRLVRSVPGFFVAPELIPNGALRILDRMGRLARRRRRGSAAADG